MAKRSVINRQTKRAQLVARHADQRRRLKKIIAHPDTNPTQRSAAVQELSKLPRDSSPSRLRNRDMVDGRPRGVLRRFGLSRIRFRDMAHRGELPGIKKSSW